MLRSVLIQLFSSFHASWLTAPSSRRLSQLSVPIEELKLKPMETNVIRSALRFQSEPDSANLVNMPDTIVALRHENGSQFMR
jgi:hypothetical protein